MWRGTPVSERVAFYPESITVDENLGERNLEYRRVLIDRVGMEWFVENARPDVIDRDQDAGGSRRLLRIPFDDGEGVLMLEVHCPSTGRRYLLRVPPQLTTCAEGAAWVAGFRSARQYRPVLET
jgi:hypothetical protein